MRARDETAAVGGRFPGPGTGRRDPGYVLVTALIMSLVVGAMVAIAARLSVVELQAASASRARAQALEAAFAGAQLQIEAVRQGGGGSLLEGPFGGGTYTALPAVLLGNRCWSITSSATVDRETRAVLVFAGPRPYPALKGAVGLQGPGLLTATVAPSGWRVSGHDTTPPSLSGDATWNDLSQIGAGPLGPAAVNGMVVATPVQRSVMFVQMLGKNPALLDGKHASGTGTGTGMNTVRKDEEPAASLAADMAGLRTGATVIASSVGAGNYGTPSSPARVFLDAGARLTSLAGTGILVITSGDVAIDTTLRWEGLVILYSRDTVDLGGIAGGEVRVYGGVIAEDPDELILAFSTARTRILYSSETMARVHAVYPGNDLTVRASRVLR